MTFRSRFCLHCISIIVKNILAFPGHLYGILCSHVINLIKRDCETDSKIKESNVFGAVQLVGEDCRFITIGIGIQCYILCLENDNRFSNDSKHGGDALR
ncbi:unnamed protein product [Onchocerca flexuosa]|uniref:Secreted protein n=1 Tax=Onchocerca flexuosa TaxID=387005 RepID=A0A183HK93_9BILA|nr:unnamed protein product [Onchocerca flexuosa]